jgi:acylphosphatase
VNGFKKAREFFISGRVQGVGFRFFAERAAREAGATGWARNLADGRVQVHANGTREQLDALEARLRMGPAHADVRGFEVREAAPEDARSFFIR